MNTKHVPDLELCQELDRLCKEKGIVVPETEFIWVKEFPIFLSQDSIVTPDEYKMKLEASPLSEEAKSLIKTFPAPLVSEQGEWLPARIVLETKLLKKEESVILYYIKYEDDASDCDGTNLEDCVKTKWTVECGKEIIRETNEANARQKSINYLIAEGIITTL